jgi:hypothetical protein
MLCLERNHLLDDYRKAARRYNDAVQEFVDKATGVVGSDMDLLRRNCRKAWEQAEQARLSLFRHEANHFCDRVDS